MIIRPLTPALAADYFDFFENRAFTDASPYRCYCQIYQMTPAQEAAVAGCAPDDCGPLARKLAEAQIASGAMKGYLAYADGAAIGWCNANDKSAYPVLARDIPELAAPAGARETAVVCFEIAPTHRGQGVATALLARAVEDARARGDAAVEAYPDVRSERYEWDCKGPMRLYERAGFTKAATHAGYAVMRLSLRSEG